MSIRTFISINEKSAPGYKVSKERLTVLLCGSWRLYRNKPLIIYNSETPFDIPLKERKGISKDLLPLHWTSNKKGWMI